MPSKIKSFSKTALTIFLIGLFISLYIMHPVNTIALLVLSYALGSIPFGYILTRFSQGTDIRTIGSGNIGATNVLRTGNKLNAALTLLLDAAKGGVAVVFLSSFSNDPSMPFIFGILAMLGHIFPVWLDFKGGKGVATGLGIIFALSWPLALIALGIWLAVALIFKYSSLAALVSVALLPLVSLLIADQSLALFSLVLGILIFIRHKDNIKNLLAGKESKIGQRSART